MQTRVERLFFKHLVKADGCWPWQGTLTAEGYGQLGTRSLRAHKVSYRIFKGEIPEGLLVLHTCHNPKCVNPNHLYLGTQRDNMDDKVLAGRVAKGPGHGMAKLTEEDVRKIAVSLRQGWSCVYLASQYSVSRYCIWSIKKGLTWSWLTGFTTQSL